MENKTKKQQLSDKKTELINQLRTGGRKGSEKILGKIRAIELQITECNKIELLNRVNTKYSRLRELALLAYQCEQPTEDITCNDGTFNKTKVKKYPKIAALPYASGTWENNILYYIRINGEKFAMYRTQWNQGKETTYIRPETFKDFLELNTIPEKDITMSEFLALGESLEKLNKQLAKALEKYSQETKKLNVYNFQCWGLASQQNKNVYQYETNNY